MELEQATRLYEQKGNLVSAARTKTLLEDMRRTAPTRLSWRRVSYPTPEQPPEAQRRSPYD